MTDVMSKKQRSEVMSRIRGRDTAPERLLRSLLHRAGLRFRKNLGVLPGRPDIVLARHQTVVLVHGCFWHRHSNCRFATMPRTNVGFWRAKFADNVQRDRRNAATLRRLGWRVITVWECQLRRNPEAVAHRILKLLRPHTMRGSRRLQAARRRG